MIKKTSQIILLLAALIWVGCGDSGSPKDGAGDTNTTTVDTSSTSEIDTTSATTMDTEVGTSAGVDTGTGIEMDTGTEPVVSNCNDGIDNDSDGYVDWQYDLGCVDANDDEASGTRALERGFSTFDVGENSVVIYVSSSLGEDGQDGLSPETAVKTLTHAASLVTDGANDFMLLRRGDTWRGESLGRFLSGQDAEHPMVIASYGEETAMPRIEINQNFIDHNGKVRSFVSIVGLELIVFPKILGDAEYDGQTGGGIRYVGGGSNLLIEGCRLTHCELVVQTYGDDLHYENVEVRRNVIELNYHIDTCGQNSAFRPSGMYASHVNGLTIEGNLFDHNGWNEDVASACGTMYNHNMYLNADGLVVRNNVIARASSMGIKMRSDVTGDADTLLFEDNFFVEGEIGMGIGGNSEEAHRFSNVTIRDNVFSQIGKTQPTDRPFAWMLDVSDVLTAVIDSNYFLHQPWHSNSYGISLGGTSTSDITVSNNLFYDLTARSLLVDSQSGWGNITVDANTFVDASHSSCLVDHRGDFSEVSYSNNSYFSGESTDWFCGEVAGNLAGWETGAKETGASQWSETFSDPGRTIDTYADSLGMQPSLEAYLAVARNQSRLNWNQNLTAHAINTYIKAGF